MIWFRAEQIQEIIAHAQAEAPLEAGGLLAGSGETVERVYPVENTDRSETSYLLDVEEQYRVFVEIEDGHTSIVRAQLDLVSRTGYWFDVREFDLED